MSIDRVKASGILSFGPAGIDLPMSPLNVLAGPDEAGKADLLEILALLHAVPADIEQAGRGRGGIGQWLLKGRSMRREATIETTVGFGTGSGRTTVRHALTLAHEGGRVQVRAEVASGVGHRYLQEHGHATTLTEDPPPASGETVRRYRVDNDQSAVAQPTVGGHRHAALELLSQQYRSMRIYRESAAGRAGRLQARRNARLRSDMLNECTDNLPNVLAGFSPDARERLIEALREVSVDVATLSFASTADTIELAVERHDGSRIPDADLPVWTLRYVTLLTLLLHASPPSLTAIEYPEAGLDARSFPRIAGLLAEAAARTQVVVTTRSHALVDALAAHPANIVFCDTENDEARFHRRAE